MAVAVAVTVAVCVCVCVGVGEELRVHSSRHLPPMATVAVGEWIYKSGTDTYGERQETVANAVVATVAVRSSVCNGAVVCHRWQQWLQERGQRDRERQETAAAAVLVSVSVVSVAVGDGVGEELSLHSSRRLPPTATAATSCDSACRKVDRQESLWRQWRWRWLSESVSVRLHESGERERRQRWQCRWQCRWLCVSVSLSMSVRSSVCT